MSRETALSVVIPALEEADGIAACIMALRPLRVAQTEIIVVDGGSQDATASIAAAAGARVVPAPRGRAVQMNAGAAAARGRLLAFLHADTRLTTAACRRLLELATQPGERWGRFDVRLSGPGVPFRMIEGCMNLRSRITGIATGDQCMFASRSLFRRAGGFPELALMEDVALSERLRRLVRPCCCRERVETSSRRWRQHGVLRTVLLMWRLRAAYALGADPARLAQRYDV